MGRIAIATLFGVIAGTSPASAQDPGLLEAAARFAQGELLR
jgi:hypothetical protein